MTPETNEPVNDPMEVAIGQDEYQEIYNEYYDGIRNFMVKTVGEDDAAESTNSAFEEIYELLAEPQVVSMIKAFVFRVAGEVAAQTLKNRKPE